MSATSRLLIIEVIIEADSVFAKLLDLMMLVAIDGRERTQSEYERLLSRAGLKLTRVISTYRPIRLLEVLPAIAS